MPEFPSSLLDDLARVYARSAIDLLMADLERNTQLSPDGPAQQPEIAQGLSEHGDRPNE